MSKKNQAKESNSFELSEPFLTNLLVLLSIFYVAILFVFSGINFNVTSLGAFLSLQGGLEYFIVVLAAALSVIIVLNKIKYSKYLAIVFWVVSLAFFAFASSVLSGSEFALAPFVESLISLINIGILVLLVLKEK